MKKMNNLVMLPEELVEDILVRLPVDSLLRFKSVSKAWQTLITSSCFIRRHLKHGGNLKIMFPDEFEDGRTLYSVAYDMCDHKEAEEVDHPFSSLHMESIYNCCDGLFLVMDSDESLNIWNPSTGECKRLPEVIKQEGSGTGYVDCGFGFDSRTKDYKVLRLEKFDVWGEGEEDCRHMEVSVYTLSANSWRRLSDIQYISCFAPHNRDPIMTLVGNRLYWFARKLADVDLSERILSFDLSTEEFREVPLPNCKNGKCFVDLMASTCGLCVSVYSNGEVEIWELKCDTQETWTKVFCVKFEQLPEPVWRVQPLHLSENGKILLSSCPENVEQCDLGPLILYDSKSNKAVILETDPDKDLDQTQIYVESLVSPNAIADTVDERLHEKKRNKMVVPFQYKECDSFIQRFPARR